MTSSAPLPAHAPAHTLLLVGEDALAPAVEAFARAEAARANSSGCFTTLAGREMYFKGSHLRGKHRWRHVARRTLLRRPFPRLAEFDNLLWLRRSGFDAPRPLVAGLLHFSWSDDYQFLATERVAAALLTEALAKTTPEARLTLTRTLAADVARMHALGFVHRDLYPRNLLVSGTPEAPRIHYLDAWRGGSRLQSRGPRYDLHCLAEGLLEHGGEPSRDAFLEAYLRLEPVLPKA